MFHLALATGARHAKLPVVLELKSTAAFTVSVICKLESVLARLGGLDQDVISPIVQVARIAMIAETVTQAWTHRSALIVKLAGWAFSAKFLVSMASKILQTQAYVLASLQLATAVQIATVNAQARVSAWTMLVSAKAATGECCASARDVQVSELIAPIMAHAMLKSSCASATRAGRALVVASLTVLEPLIATCVVPASPAWILRSALIVRRAGWVQPVSFHVSTATKIPRTAVSASVTLASAVLTARLSAATRVHAAASLATRASIATT